jgi:V8-like Glu-specific endopeptidase
MMVMHFMKNKIQGNPKITMAKSKRAVNIKNCLLVFTLILISLPGKAQEPSKLDTITQTSQYPYDQVVYQEIIRKRAFIFDRPYQSTGFFIAPNVILTAAHNLYSNKLTKVTEITLFPGRYNDSTPYPPLTLKTERLWETNIFVHPNFSWNKSEYDFGIIIIPDSLINLQERWPVDIHFKLDESFKMEINDSIEVAGFPASHGYDGSLMTHQKQKVFKLNKKTIPHALDTQTGNSGSPIWINKNGTHYIVGVHTYANLATRIDTEYIVMINNWINAFTH